MENPAIFSATLGLAYPWQVTAVAFARDENRLEITVDFDHGNHFTCPCCGTAALAPCGWETETWHHADFFRYSTYLNARVPRVECPCGKVLPVERPWSRAGSRFSRLQ
jgi:transposase